MSEVKKLLFIIAIITVIVLVLPRRTFAQTSSFVTRTGNKLYLNGRLFRFAGPNIHWLGAGDEGPVSHIDIDQGLDEAKAMGATVIRAHTLGISTGASWTLEPALNQFNDTYFSNIDYAIAGAASRNIKLIIPLTDNWHFYHGGKHDFTDWRGVAEDQFFSNITVIADFKTYIAHLLNHTNQYTGIQLKNDPTILAWETGNELNGDIMALVAWTQNIAHYIKYDLAAKQLVADGRIGQYGNWHIDPSQFSSPDVDMYANHEYWYGLSVDGGMTFIKTDAASAVAAGKVFYLGEYDWSQSAYTNALLPVIENQANAISGDLFWDLLLPRMGTAQGSYSMIYPGLNSSMQAFGDQLKQHAMVMSSQNAVVPTTTVGVTATPTNTSIPTITSTPLPGNLIIQTPLQLSKNTVFPGDTVTATVTYKNNGSSPITIQAMSIGGRAPGGTNAGGPWYDFGPDLGITTIQPGGTLTMTATRTFTSSDQIGPWYAFSTYQDTSLQWHDAPSTLNQIFQVGTVISPTTPVMPTLTPTPTNSLTIIYPPWWNPLPPNLKNFLEQLYTLVYYFHRSSNLHYLLEGVFPTH